MIHEFVKKSSPIVSSLILIRTWTKIVDKAGFKPLHFTKQENTMIQTCAVACYNIAIGGGFGSYFLGLNKKTYELVGVNTEGNITSSYKELQIGWMTAYLFVVCFVGLFVLVPLRKLGALLEATLSRVAATLIELRLSMELVIKFHYMLAFGYVRSHDLVALVGRTSVLTSYNIDRSPFCDNHFDDFIVLVARIYTVNRPAFFTYYEVCSFCKLLYCRNEH